MNYKKIGPFTLRWWSQPAGIAFELTWGDRENRALPRLAGRILELENSISIVVELLYP